MKTLFKLHPLTYICMLIALFTGYFKEMIIFMSIILVHEMGHVLASKLMHWKLDYVLIFPFGGVTIFNEKINRPLKEEFIISIMGPIFQIVYSLFLNNKIVSFYSEIILIFNLIPIFPLDGSKLLNIILNKLFSFKKSYILTIYLSYFFGFILIFYLIINKEYLYLIAFIILIFKLKQELKKNNIIFNKFLYERYLYDFNFKKVKVVSDIYELKKDYYHYFNINYDLINEKKYLNKMYK